MRLSRWILASVLLLSAACGGEKSVGPGDDQAGDGGSGGASAMAAVLVGGSGFWFQPDFEPPIDFGLGATRTHAVFVFREDGTGRRQTILVQPNGFIPTSQVLHYGWEVEGNVLRLQFTFPGQNREEQVRLNYDSQDGSFAVASDTHSSVSDGTGFWFPCSQEGCAELLFAF